MQLCKAEKRIEHSDIFYMVSKELDDGPAAFLNLALGFDGEIIAFQTLVKKLFPIHMLMMREYKNGKPHWLATSNIMLC